MKKVVEYGFYLVLVGLLGWGVYSCASLFSPIAVEAQKASCNR